MDASISLRERERRSAGAGNKRVALMETNGRQQQQHSFLFASLYVYVSPLVAGRAESIRSDGHIDIHPSTHVYIVEY